MLKNVLEFVMSRTALTRADALREINYAWKEIWSADDLPDSLFEITVAPIDNTARVSLPYYVGEVRGVKMNCPGGRVVLNTPRPWYQDDTYLQSLWTWRLLATSPLIKSITNATTLTLTFIEPVSAPVTVTLIGPNDNGTEVREMMVFDTGDVSKITLTRFTDLLTVTKDIITGTDLHVMSVNEDIAIVSNAAFEARNQVVQITDKHSVVCTNCRCYDILYKKSTPYLYYDESYVAYEEVLMAKTMEWITLPKDNQDKKAMLYGAKARELLTQFNSNDRGVEHKMDIGRNTFYKQYTGYL